MKKVRYFLEAIFLYIFYGFCAILPPATASNVGGWIGRTIGLRMAASRKALANVALALPEKSEEERKAIIGEMWENLGRVMAEYPHLMSIARNSVNVINQNIVEDAVAEKNGLILIGAHMGNWETYMATLAVRIDAPASLTYRAANNPYADKLLERSRTLDGKIKAIPKARSSGKDLMTAMKNKEIIGILIDQKYNEGIPVNFFGKPAMTNPIPVALCQKYKAALIPARNRRTGPAQFEITVGDPIPLFADDGTPLDVAVVLENAHRVFESWIREEPAQWLWLHRRWNSSTFKDSN